MRRSQYVALHGPTTGDRIHLGDTGLVIQVEQDSQQPGDEFLIGFGRTARDGAHMRAVSVADSCDVVISNVVVLDPLRPVQKASIGIRDGRISCIGRAGNPDTTHGIDVVVGTGTSVIPGEGLIATAGAIDTHVHLMAPRILDALLASGVTTVLGQEFGPVWGTGVNSPWALRAAHAALDAWPLNVGMLARGSSSRPEPLVEALVTGGACGFKVHEDTGAHPRALDTALRVADEYDVQVALHTDGLNESMRVDGTLDVIDGRSVHIFHVEGCGGGHSPDVLRLAGVPHVITSSTNPTIPYGRDAASEHFEMIVATHGLSRAMPTDVAIVEDRIRPSTMGAEDVLHDLGVIPIMSSDAQGMGRAGETVRRTFALASKMKGERGSEETDHDNDRVLRYLAKLTVNPALAHGLAHEVGALRPGLLADIVLWRPALFAAKPHLVLKSGFPAWGTVGDPNSTVECSQPTVLGTQFGGMGGAPAELAVAFVARGLIESGQDRLPTRRRRVPVRDTRHVAMSDMVGNSRCGNVTVDSASGAVCLDGELLTSRPVERVALSRRYFL